MTFPGDGVSQEQDRMGYPPHLGLWDRTGWGTPPGGQVMLGQVMAQAVGLLQFPTGGLSCLTHKTSIQTTIEAMN